MLSPLFFSACQYFEVKIEYTAISSQEFTAKMNQVNVNLNELFAKETILTLGIKENIKS